MFMNHQPVVGNWYMNKTGKLLKVKLLMYADTQPSSVVIEFLDGSRQIVDYTSWSCLELHRHAQETTQFGVH